MNAIPLDLVLRNQECVDAFNQLKLKHPRFCGIIVAGYRKGLLDPICFWNGYYLEHVGDGIEYPKKFRTVANAVKSAMKFDKEKCVEKSVMRVDMILPSFWIAPEIPDSPPLAKYLLMTGNQFPGSPQE